MSANAVVKLESLQWVSFVCEHVRSVFVRTFGDDARYRRLPGVLCDSRCVDILFCPKGTEVKSAAHCLCGTFCAFESNDKSSDVQSRS